jgi:hypothetical protein
MITPTFFKFRRSRRLEESACSVCHEHENCVKPPRVLRFVSLFIAKNRGAPVYKRREFRVALPSENWTSSRIGVDCEQVIQRHSEMPFALAEIGHRLREKHEVRPLSGKPAFQGECQKAESKRVFHCRKQSLPVIESM